MKWRTLIPAMIALLVLGGCIIDPPLHLRQALKTIVKVIWKADMYPDGQKPDGVTFYIFRDGQPYDRQTTSDVDSCRVHLVPGKYRIYMISQSPDEFWTMSFNDMDDFDNASISLNETEVNWLTPDPDSPVVLNPEMLMVGVSDEFEITTKMTEDYQYYYSYLKKMAAASGKTKTKAVTNKTEDDDDDLAYYEERVEYYTIRIPVHPKSIVSQMWVSIYAKNADVLKAVRASNSGMARTFELTQGVTGSEEAIQIINQWTLTIDDEANRIGHVDGIITTFGLPNGEVPSAKRDSTLNVSALLIDDKTTADYVFNTGDKIKLLPPNVGYRAMYRLIFGSAEEPVIVLPDVTPPGGKASGMDATVEDWEDGETVEIPM